MIDILEGTWHLVHSNFKMWHKGSIADVTFNYTPIQKRGKVALLDEVKYTEDGTPKCITGYDYINDDSVFTWHGIGLLSLIRSSWQVEWMDKDCEYMLISFNKTLLTPAGVDILTRHNKPSATVIDEVWKLLQVNERLNKLSEGLKPVLRG